MSLPRELAVMAEQCTGRGARGVAVAAAPQAAHIGARVLEEGGNAFDAVVAMGLAETVLLPPKCGLGGDLIAIARSASRDPEALVAVGGAPGGLAGVVESGQWSDTGPCSVGPPGAPAGYAALAARGTKSLDELARPAIQLARHGFAWAEVCHDLAAQSTQLVAAWNPDGCDYYPNGAPFATGDVVRLTRLADALEIYAARPNEFLHGEVGRAIVDAVQARGGVITLADMEHASAEWMQCVSSDVQGHRLWVTPAPTYGPTLLAAVAGAHNASTVADEYHRFIVAMRANREALADPSGTSMVSAADTLGNVVTMVHSNSYPRFGSGIVVSDYQLILNNRAGRGFTPVPGHPNFPVAGRRPATTLHAWALRSERGDYYSGATPGGANQVPWNTQTIGQIIAGVSEPGVLVTSPRWEWLPDDDGVRLEGGFTEEKLGNIEELAPRTVRSPRWATRAAQQVVRVSSARDAAIVGGADPRTVGAAVGVNVTPVVN